MNLLNHSFDDPAKSLCVSKHLGFSISDKILQALPAVQDFAFCFKFKAELMNVFILIMDEKNVSFPHLWRVLHL